MRDLGSILTSFCEQLLRAKIPRAQKKTVRLSSFFALLGSARVKADRRMLVKLNPENLVLAMLWGICKERSENFAFAMTSQPTSAIYKERSVSLVQLFSYFELGIFFRQILCYFEVFLKL